MFGIEMLFKAIGLDDAAIAQLRELMNPAEIKKFLDNAGAEISALKAQLDRIENQLTVIGLQQQQTALVAHGAKVMDPNFTAELDRQLLAAASDFDGPSAREKFDAIATVESENPRPTFEALIEQAVTPVDAIPNAERPPLNFFQQNGVFQNDDGNSSDDGHAERDAGGERNGGGSDGASGN